MANDKSDRETSESATRQQLAAEIQRVYAIPGWVDSKGRDHQAAIDRLSFLYAQLYPK